MKWTKKPPTEPGHYWFKRFGRRERVPEVARVYRHRGILVCHIGTWPGTDFADHDNFLRDYSSDHLWSDEAIPEPEG